MSDDLFYLVDTSGRCAIDPDGAAVTPQHLNTWYGTTRIPGRYHDDDGAWWARAMGQLGQPYRYTERRIEPGDQIYALGHFTTHGRPFMIAAGTEGDITIKCNRWAAGLLLLAAPLLCAAIWAVTIRLTAT